jgi:hypothetical protein
MRIGPQLPFENGRDGLGNTPRLVFCSWPMRASALGLASERIDVPCRQLRWNQDSPVFVLCGKTAFSQFNKARIR